MLPSLIDYILVKQLYRGPLLHGKLHRLLYYSQAWHLAEHEKPLFTGKFQAWVFGPVCKPLFDLLGRNLFEPLGWADITDVFCPEKDLKESVRLHVDGVLEAYGHLTSDQLDNMTTAEDPWLAARSGYARDERCEKEIDEALMGSFYRKRLIAGA